MGIRKEKLKIDTIVSKEWDNIGNLIKTSLHNFPSGDPVDPWSDLEKKVIRSNFIKFSFTTFNVFYLSILIVLGATAGIVSFNAVKLGNQVKRQNVIIKEYQRKAIEETTKSKADAPNMEINKTTSPVQKEKAKKNTTIKPVDLSKARLTTDTVTRIIVNKKVVKRQIIMRNPTQVKDSLVLIK